MVDRLLTFWVDGDEDRFEPLFRDAPIMIHSIDAQGNIIKVSQYWLQFFGYTESDVIGRKSSEFLTEDSREKAVKEVLPAFFETGVCSDIEYQFIKGDGTTADISLSAIAERDGNGVYARSLAVLFDISERKRAEREREAARVEAVRASKAKSEFLAAMSNAFRTPLGIIDGFTSLMIEDEMSARHSEYILQISQAADQLTRLTDNLLDLGKIESGHFSIRPVNFNPTQVLNELHERWTPVAQDKGIAFTAASHENVPATMIGDPVRINQVLSSFIDNAVKFTETGGISLSAEEVNGRLVLSVKDTGVGISEDDQKHVFSRMDEADNLQHASNLGWGVGMSVARELADLMWGAVGVESVEGGGSRFWLSLPLMASTPD